MKRIPRDRGEDPLDIVDYNLCHDIYEVCTNVENEEGVQQTILYLVSHGYLELEDK